MATIQSRFTSATNTYTTSKFTSETRCNWMRINYTSDATVGNRQIVTELYNGDGDLIWTCSAGAVQAASTVNNYLWMPGIYRETTFINNSLQVPFPTNMTLLGNWTLKVYDSANISSGDSMIIDMQHRDSDLF